MSKQFAALLAVIVLLFVGLFVYNNHTKNAGAKSSTSSLSNHVEGSSSLGIKLVEYGDFQCPYCQAASPVMNTVAAEFKDQMQFQYRNFPLVNNHPNAFAAARAAEAAALQNKYWEMHNILYENNDPSGRSGWVAASDPTTYFNQFATNIGLNLAQFKTDYASSKVNDTINADMAEGTKLNVQGTPSFFLDGKQITVANNVAAFEKVIKAEIAKKAPAAKTTPAATPAGASSTTPAAASGTVTTTPPPTSGN
jgi:protein-disulfide isomerase